MHQTSPGVERAVQRAGAWAERLGATEVRLADLVLGLLDEEEGRPAVLLERLGLVPADVRQSIVSLPLTKYPPAPPLIALYDAARDWSLANRADPAFMTDALLLAVLEVDPDFGMTVRRFGLDVNQLAALMTGDETPIAPPGDTTTAFILPDSTDDLDAARVLDANLNRAREALRVLEDYCRFVLDDRFLTGEVKAARHDLAEAAAQIAPQLLLAGRETLRDVGTTVSASGEYDRGSPRQVAAVNLKRLQESLRSLEEYGKLFGPQLGRDLEAIRYRAYTLERAIVIGSGAREKLARAQLYVLLTGAQCAASMDWVIERAAAGGAALFQLREKTMPDRELLERARNVRRWTRMAGTLFVVNDRPDVAKLVEADGVHLGQDDMPVREARRIVGPDALIGVSTHSITQVRQAVLDGADYIGVGPTFPSKTKVFDAFPGLAFVRTVAAETSLPAFALGGISPENIGQVVAAGGQRVAVGSAVSQAEDPEPIARVLRAALEG
ncbi:MAG: thiE [Gemmataceae bacterium]|nr:thiE [Gemmataceae bacterium]